MFTANHEKNYQLFNELYLENKTNAVKLLLYTRDIREGNGEREIFRRLLVNISKYNVELTMKLFKEDIAFFGRYDDEFAYYDELSQLAQSLIMEKTSMQLDEDIHLMKKNKKISLLAKWLPSINTSSKRTRYIANLIRKDLNLSPRQYRKMLSRLRQHIDIVETKICNKDFSSINYYKLQKESIYYHYKVFIKYDKERFEKFLDDNKSIYIIHKEPTLEEIFENPRYDIAEKMFLKDI